VRRPQERRQARDIDERAHGVGGGGGENTAAGHKDQHLPRAGRLGYDSQNAIENLFYFTPSRSWTFPWRRNLTQMVLRFPGSFSFDDDFPEVVPRPVVDHVSDAVQLIGRIFLWRLSTSKSSRAISSPAVRWAWFSSRASSLVRHVREKSLAARTLQPDQPLLLPCLITSMSKCSLHTEQYWLIVFVFVLGIEAHPILRRLESCNTRLPAVSCGISYHRVCTDISRPTPVRHRPPQQLVILDVLFVLYNRSAFSGLPCSSPQCWRQTTVVNHQLGSHRMLCLDEAHTQYLGKTTASPQSRQAQNASQFQKKPVVKRNIVNITDRRGSCKRLSAIVCRRANLVDQLSRALCEIASRSSTSSIPRDDAPSVPVIPSWRIPGDLVRASSIAGSKTSRILERISHRALAS